MFVFIVSVLLYLYLSVSLFACLYITILSVLPEWRINFIIFANAKSAGAVLNVIRQLGTSELYFKRTTD